MEPGVRAIEAHQSSAAVALLGWLRPAELAVNDTSAASAAIHLRLLAVPALVRGDGALIALERKDAALLALLAVDGSISRQRAGALLLADSQAPHARKRP